MSFSDAKKLYDDGKYDQALEAYQKIGAILGDKVVEFNINKCLDKINEDEKNINVNTISANTISAEYEKKNTVSNLIQQVNDYYKSLPKFQSNTLVSVIMTSHNSEQYIESAVNSLLDQSYQNIEIIIVDDYSQDNTIKILHRLSTTHKKVRYLQLNNNLGTYFAKNLGILHAKGDVIFFHDSDDVCHRNRIEISLQALENNPNKIAVRTAYARIDPISCNIIKVDEYDYKLGLITLGIKRSVFNKIGFFNCTTKASDDEFYNRMKSYYKKQNIIDISQPLYFNTMRAGSLISDMIEMDEKQGGGGFFQKYSKSRSDYIKTFTQHQKSSMTKFVNTFVFPVIRDVLPVYEDMTKLANPTIPVYVNICSIPQRESKLKRVIGSLINQCDQIYVYLDGYAKIPDFLNHSKITVNQSTKKGILRDNGKFIMLEKLAASNKDAYYFAVDDDIIYPLDYVNTMIKKLNYYEDKVVIGIHGMTLPKDLDRYFSSRRKVFSFYKSLESDKLVHVLGTGTIAFNTKLFHGFQLNSFACTGMSDIFFAIECKKRHLAQIAIMRHDRWLQEMEKDTSTLFEEFKLNDSTQTNLAHKYRLNEYIDYGELNFSSALLEKLPKIPILLFYDS